MGATGRNRDRLTRSGDFDGQPSRAMGTRSLGRRLQVAAVALIGFAIACHEATNPDRQPAGGQ